MTESGVFDRHAETVLPEWVDYNGHMNVAYYVLAFDHATDAVLDHFGLGRAYAETCRRSLFVVEAHIAYLREVTAGDRLLFRSRTLGADERRLRLFHEMRQEADGFLAATAEFMLVHVDMDSRRATPFDAGDRDRLAAAVAGQAALPVPAQAGRAVAMRPPAAG